jgi:DNA-binding beta-propeller fold protein YncE
MRPHPRRLIFAALGCFILTALLARAEKIVLVAGGTEDHVNLPAERVRLKEPFGVDFDRGGNFFIVEMASGNRLLRVDASSRLTHIAGLPTSGDSGDGSPALSAQFNGPHNLAVLPDGNVLIGDTWNGRVRHVDLASGRVSSLPGYGVDAAQGRANGPYCITLDFTGTRLLIADLRRVQSLDLKTHRLTLVAGNGTKGIPADENNLIRKYVPATGKILRVAGTGKKGAAGIGGPPEQCELSRPHGVTVHADGTLFITDTYNNRVLKIVP